MNSKTEKTGRRIVWEEKNYTIAQRIRLKAKGLLAAALMWKTPKSYFVARYLNPGDAGYDAALEEESIIWHRIPDNVVPNENYK